MTFGSGGVNDLVGADNLEYLLKYDAVHGRYNDSKAAIGRNGDTKLSGQIVAKYDLLRA